MAGDIVRTETGEAALAVNVSVTGRLQVVGADLSTGGTAAVFTVGLATLDHHEARRDRSDAALPELHVDGCDDN